MRQTISVKFFARKDGATGSGPGSGFHEYFGIERKWLNIVARSISIWRNSLSGIVGLGLMTIRTIIVQRTEIDLVKKMFPGFIYYVCVSTRGRTAVLDDFVSGNKITNEILRPNFYFAYWFKYWSFVLLPVERFRLPPELASPQVVELLKSFLRNSNTYSYLTIGGEMVKSMKKAAADWK